MKSRIFLITLFVTTLTACAVDKNADTQEAASTTEQARIEEQTRELANRTGKPLSSIMESALQVWREGKGS